MRAGRPLKCYVASYDTSIKVPGLSRQGGRWRTWDGHRETRFTEASEVAAIKRAREILGIELPIVPQNVRIEMKPTRFEGQRLGPIAAGLLRMAVAVGPDASPEQTKPVMNWENGEAQIGYNLDPSIIWPWVAQQFQADPEYVAKMIGAPEGSFRKLGLPSPAIRMNALIDAYTDHKDVKQNRKNTVKKTWKQFCDVTGAKTLEDLTAKKVLAFKDALVAEGHSGETLKQYYSRVKAVIEFGLERAIDAVQIRTALDVCAVLVPPKIVKKVNPKDISPADFHALLTAAKNDDVMTAAILLSLNAALYASECVAVEWAELDLDNGTFCTLRGKTGLVRSAVLWPETINALYRLPRNGVFVFQSSTGLAYTVGTMRAMFNAMRKAAANVSEEVQFSHLRDGAATACVMAKVAPDQYKLLMGHALSGEMDNYARRNAAMCVDACTAVYNAYFPAPAATPAK